MIAHEIRLAGDTNRLIGWLDLNRDARHLAAITIPFLTGPNECKFGEPYPREFGQLRLPFVTIEPNRCLIADPEDLPILRRLGCFRPHD